MTPTEVAAKLRQFNEWRRDFDDKVEQPDSYEIGEAIDAAIELIERLEAVEQDRRTLVFTLGKECAVVDAAKSECLEQVRLLSTSREREAALMAKLEAAEKERVIDEQRIADLMAELNRVGHENAELRAKIAEMEQQEIAERAAAGVADLTARLENKDKELLKQAAVVVDLRNKLGQARAAYHELQESPTLESTDPALNGGWKLVPIEPTQEMITAALESTHVLNVHRAVACYDAMLAVAPEVKP